MALTVEKLYKMREASAILRVHPNTIRRWDREGKIKVVRTKRGHRRVPESEIDRIVHQTTAAIAQPPSQAASRDEGLAAFLNFVFSYHRDDWDLVRRAVIVRDNYTCQECGGREMITVHHKDGTSRNEPENLITLCQKCHAKIHQQTVSQQKEQEKEATKAPPPKIGEKTTIIETPPAPAPQEAVKVPRVTILNALEPVGLAQRAAFGDLLSAAVVLKRFSSKDLTARARCPESIANLFCERMKSLGHILDKNGIFELQIEVTR
jgi:excisionase family DNA binding protein